MNKGKNQIDQVKIGLVIGLLATMMGCAGLGGGGYYGNAVVVADEPDMYLFGGEYDGRRDVHNYSNRGSESRGAAHPSASHGGGHSSGGKGTRR